MTIITNIFIYISSSVYTCLLYVWSHLGLTAILWGHYYHPKGTLRPGEVDYLAWSYSITSAFPPDHRCLILRSIYFALPVYSPTAENIRRHKSCIGTTQGPSLGMNILSWDHVRTGFSAGRGGEVMCGSSASLDCRRDNVIGPWKKVFFFLFLFFLPHSLKLNLQCVTLTFSFGTPALFSSHSPTPPFRLLCLLFSI